MSTKAQRKHHISALCDADQYEPIVTACLSEKQAKALPPRHLSNGLALFAELMLTHYDGVSEAFVTNNGVEVSLKFVVGPQKDELKLSYKPVSEVKDSAIATVPDPEQEEMPFMKGKESKPASAPVSVDAEILPPGLPAPILALPEPEKTEAEREAFAEGRDAFANGPAIGTCPYDHATDPALCRAWHEGWRAEEAEAIAGDDDDDTPLDLREGLTDHDEEE